MFSLNLRGSYKPNQVDVPAYEVTPEETQKGKSLQPIFCI